MTKTGSNGKSAENKEKRALSFYIEEAEAGDPSRTTTGLFDTPKTISWLRLHERLEALSANAKTYKALFNRLDRMIEKEPDFLDAYNCAGDASLNLADREEDDSFGFFIWVDSARKCI